MFFFLLPSPSYGLLSVFDASFCVVPFPVAVEFHQLQSLPMHECTGHFCFVSLVLERKSSIGGLLLLHCISKKANKL